MPTAYCITGLPGAGKTEVANITERKNIQVISMGEVVVRNAKNELEKATSENISNWATEQRKENKQIFAELTIEEINTKNDVIIEGVRSKHEIELFSKYYDDVHVVAVTAPIDEIIERTKQRQRRDENEESIRTRLENEKQWGVGKLIEESDTIIENNQGLEELEQSVLNFLERRNIS